MVDFESLQLPNFVSEEGRRRSIICRSAKKTDFFEVFFVLLNYKKYLLYAQEEQHGLFLT